MLVLLVKWDFKDLKNTLSTGCKVKQFHLSCRLFIHVNITALKHFINNVELFVYPFKNCWYSKSKKYSPLFSKETTIGSSSELSLQRRINVCYLTEDPIHPSYKLALLKKSCFWNSISHKSEKWSTSYYDIFLAFTWDTYFNFLKDSLHDFFMFSTFS